MTGDDVAVFRDALARHKGDADLIITTGGVSAGAYEVVKDALGGQVEFVKVAMQPGMPQGSGVVDGTPIITLPGNPVSALVSFEVFLRSPLRGAMGLPNADRPRRTAVLTEDLTSPRGKRQFRRGVLDPTAGTVTSYGPPASHHLRWLASANCLLEIEEDVVRTRRRVACSRVGLGIAPLARPPARRIATRWPDAPTSNPAPRGSSRWCAPPFRRCTRQACRSSVRAWRSPRSGTGTLAAEHGARRRRRQRRVLPASAAGPADPSRSRRGARRRTDLPHPGGGAACRTRPARNAIAAQSASSCRFWTPTSNAPRSAARWSRSRTDPESSIRPNWRPPASSTNATACDPAHPGRVAGDRRADRRPGGPPHHL